MKLIRLAVTVITTTMSVVAQTPGVDPRGVMTHSSLVIIGIVEEPWQKIIRPDKVKVNPPKSTKHQDGTVLVELSFPSRDYMVGYIYHVRVQEILKDDRQIKTNQVIQIYVPENLEDGVSLPAKQRFILALSRFEPNKEVFENTTVSRMSEPLSKPGLPFDFRGRYYRVVADRNGAISVTEKTRRLIEDTRVAIKQSH
jgi:hypothetical protein